MDTSDVSTVAKRETVNSEEDSRRPPSPKSSVHPTSRASASSKRSSYYRSVHEAAARARASAEAAATKGAYAKKQLEIKKQRARLDIELEELEIEKEAEAARVKADVLEAAAAAAIENEDVLSLKSDVSPRVIQKRTEEYVQSQSLLGSQSILPHYGVRRSENATQSPPHAAAEEMPPRNAFRPPVNDRAEAAQRGEARYGADTKQFVLRHFYVDDGLVSMPTDSAAIDLLKRTCASLVESNLKLHKIASNSVAVMRAFEPEELASGIRDLGLDDETLPAQRSLGLCWDINTDMFTFKVAVTDKPDTLRGVLSIVNSVFDPLGLAAPVTIRGRLLLRELSRGVQDWDAALPVEKVSTWEMWK